MHSIRYSVLLPEVVKIVGKRDKRNFLKEEKTEKEENEREEELCMCFCDKIKWNIKHTVLGDTKWTWLNEKPHCINYVRPLFWGKAEAHTDRRNPKILVCCQLCRPQLFGLRHIDRRWTLSLFQMPKRNGTWGRKNNQKGNYEKYPFLRQMYEYKFFFILCCLCAIQ